MKPMNGEICVMRLENNVAAHRGGGRSTAPTSCMVLCRVPPWPGGTRRSVTGRAGRGRVSGRPVGGCTIPKRPSFGRRERKKETRKERTEMSDHREHRRPLYLSRPQFPQRLVCFVEGEDLHLRPYRDFRSEREELIPILSRQVGHGSYHTFFP